MFLLGLMLLSVGSLHSAAAAQANVTTNQVSDTEARNR